MAPVRSWWPLLATGGADGRVQDRVAEQIRLTDPDAAGPLTAAERQAWLRRLDGVAFVSDGALPFADNVEQAARPR